MPRARKDALRERLRTLEELREAPPSAERDQAVRAAIEADESRIVAKAAALAREHGIDVALATLEERFAWFAERGPKRDPGCVAKLALVELIDDRELPIVDLLCTGASFVQPEPVWGSTEDTAGALRGQSTLALVHLRSSHAPGAIVARLAASTPVERRVGVEALCTWADPLWTPALLRFRLAVGEADPDVRMDLYGGLIEFDREGTLPLLQETLRSGSADEAEAAALALGAARVEEALEWLVEAVRSPLRRRQAPTMIAAVALLRLPRSVEALIGFVRTQRWTDARVALEALEPYLDDDDMARRVEEAAAANADPAVAEGLRGVLASR